MLNLCPVINTRSKITRRRRKGKGETKKMGGENGLVRIINVRKEMEMEIRSEGCS
jgi:hypothetical protein